MTFSTPRSAYDRYMGRYSDPLADAMTIFAAPPPEARALDVGCGPGALTARLADQLGAENVAAADPSEPLLAACLERVPGVDARNAGAQNLPWDTETFDLVISQLVLNFIPDVTAAVTEFVRLTKPGGTIAACTWDYADGMKMLSGFWSAARQLDTDAPDEGTTMHPCTPQELSALWRAAGITDFTTEVLVVSTTYRDFDDFWEPFTLGVGPGGAYVATLDPEQRDQLRTLCWHTIGSPSREFRLEASAFAVKGTRV